MADSCTPPPVDGIKAIYACDKLISSAYLSTVYTNSSTDLKMYLTNVSIHTSVIRLSINSEEVVGSKMAADTMVLIEVTCWYLLFHHSVHM